MDWVLYISRYYTGCIVLEDFRFISDERSEAHIYPRFALSELSFAHASI